MDGVDFALLMTLFRSGTFWARFDVGVFCSTEGLGGGGELLSCGELSLYVVPTSPPQLSEGFGSIGQSSPAIAFGTATVVVPKHAVLDAILKKFRLVPRCASRPSARGRLKDKKATNRVVVRRRLMLPSPSKSYCIR